MRPLAVLAVAALVTVTACSAGGGDDTTAEANGDEPVTVVATVAPLAEAAERIGGDLVRVTSLAAPGVEPHDVELTTRQVDAIEDAAVVLYVGGGFQPAVEEAISRRSPDGTLDVLPVGAVDAPAPPPVPPHEHAPGEPEHDHGVARDDDPHVWLDPVRYAAVVREIADTIAGTIGEGPDVERVRAAGEQLAGEVEALHGEFEQGLATCRRRTIVTPHAAFGHLALRYRLTERSLAGTSPEAEPDPEALAELADHIRDDGITTVFAEPGAESDVAATLAAEAGVTTAVLDPLERPAEGGYLAAMRRNLAALRAALDCT